MPSNQPTNDRTGLPSDTTRGVVSVILLIHLFCILVALSANLAPSALQGRLLNLFSPYTETLNFDLDSTPYELTHINEIDEENRIELLPDESRIELLPQGKDETDEKNWIVLPDVGFRGGDRRQRYQRLAHMLSFLADNGEPTSRGTIGRGISDNYIYRTQIKIVKIRCRRWVRNPPNDENAEEAYSTSGAFRVVYLADVIDTGGEIKVSEISLTGRSARPDVEGN